MGSRFTQGRGKQLLEGGRLWDVLQGLQLHDTEALRALYESLAQEVRRPFEAKTRIVATGDLSGRGGLSVVRAAMRLVRRAAVSLKLDTPLMVYGNHDVWIAEVGLGLPALSPAHELATSRSDLRDRLFPGPWPQLDLWRVEAPARALRIHALDTVLHSPVWNTLAQGMVQRDRYWEEHPGPDQLEALRAHLRPQDIHIVLTHHPVHDPGELLNPSGLGNASEVARALRDDRGRPLVQLILSGHTHKVFPMRLPERVDSQRAHAPLVEDQAQLTVGTAAQAPLLGGPTKLEQTWAALELYLDDDELVVRRVVYAREAGRYHFEPGPPQQMRLRLRAA